MLQILELVLPVWKWPKSHRSVVGLCQWKYVPISQQESRPVVAFLCRPSAPPVKISHLVESFWEASDLPTIGKYSWRRAPASLACIHPPRAFKDGKFFRSTSKECYYPTHFTNTKSKTMFIISLLTVVVMYCIYGALSTECFHARSALPIVHECQDLTQAIAYLSRLPNENNVKAWGRRLPTGPETQNVPKVYWIVGRGPKTCAVHVECVILELSLPDSRLRSNSAPYSRST